MRKLLSLVLSVFMTVSLLAAGGCSGKTASKKGSRIKIVATIFPEYDWVMNVLGDKASGADVTMLLDKGVDLHSFRPTAEDILKVSSADLFIYVGGESDEWVEDVLKEAVNKNMVTIDLMKVLGDSIKEEELVEGMEEEEHEEEHGHDHEEVEYDEHVWLSLRNAQKIVLSISEALQKIDPANASAYKKNADSYNETLKALDAKYKTAVDDASKKAVLFADRFPFRYLTDDYGLKYYAAFAGCSAESEASFETIAFLSKKVDELSLSAVLTIEGKDHRIAKTVIGNTQKKDQKILTMDSMQSTTLEDVKKGASYIKAMESNLDVLKEALK